MVQIKLKNPTVSRLNKTMKSYAKIYNNISLKYDYRKKNAILTLTGRKK